MTQAKFTLEESQVEFLERYRELGFRDKSDMVRAALRAFHQEIKQSALERSADLYQELYAEDSESQAWVEDSSRGWPS